MVKRSGWQPPKDSGLWDIADIVQDQVGASVKPALHALALMSERERANLQQAWKSLSPAKMEFLKAELDFFDQVTNVSGKLYPVPKDERKAAAVDIVRKVG